MLALISGEIGYDREATNLNRLQACLAGADADHL